LNREDKYNGGCRKRLNDGWWRRLNGGYKILKDEEGIQFRWKKIEWWL
jgi:hypothetical protein